MRHLGLKLRRAREKLGITQDELAKRVGLSSEFISLLEMGKRRPSLDRLQALAEFLHKDVTYFFEIRSKGFETLEQDKTLGKSAKKIIQNFKKFSADYLMLEEQSGIRPEEAPLYLSHSAKRMAKEERRRLGLGRESVPNFLSIVETNGLRLFLTEVPEDAQLSAVFVYLEPQGAGFALINIGIPVEDVNTIAAHIYCHFLKDRFNGPIIDNPDVFTDAYLTLYHPRERFAQKFAANLLVCPDMLDNTIEREISSRTIQYHHLLYLKRRFQVSVKIILNMLREKNYISPAKFREFLSRPLESDEQILFGLSPSMQIYKKVRGKLHQSERFRLLAFEAYKKKKISDEKLSQLLGLSKKDLEMLK